MLQPLVTNLLDSPLHDWVNATVWLWPLMEILHFFGLSLLLGSLFIIDTRMAGHIRALSLAAVHRLLPLAFIGFGLNLVTGLLFFCGDPERYAINIGFRIKMLLVVVAGINAVVYYWKIHPVMSRWDADAIPPFLAKAVAYTSLVAWAGVLVLGRLIPYVGTG